MFFAINKTKTTTTKSSIHPLAKLSSSLKNTK